MNIGLAARKRRCNFLMVTSPINLRQSMAADYEFALSLYLQTIRPYSEELIVWDEAKQKASFAVQWKPEEVRIIVLDGQDIGWFQVAEMPKEFRLLQFFVFPVYQRTGVGTEVLGNLLGACRSTGKSVALTVLKNNPARRLYERLGFSVVGEVGVKFEMKC